MSDTPLNDAVLCRNSLEIDFCQKYLDLKGLYPHNYQTFYDRYIQAITSLGLGFLNSLGPIDPRLAFGSSRQALLQVPTVDNRLNAPSHSHQKPHPAKLYKQPTPTCRAGFRLLRVITRMQGSREEY